jgi:hypothetical protein
MLPKNVPVAQTEEDTAKATVDELARSGTRKILGGIILADLFVWGVFNFMIGNVRTYRGRWEVGGLDYGSGTVIPWMNLGMLGLALVLLVPFIASLVRSVRYWRTGR